MVLPLVVLAAGAVFAGYLGVPEGLSGGRISNYFERLLEPSLAFVREPPVRREVVVDGESQVTETNASRLDAEAVQDHRLERALTGVSIVIALAGIGIGWVWFNRKPLWEPPRLLEHKYYVDEAYDVAVVQPIKVGSIDVLWKFIDVRIIDGAVNGAGQLAGLFGGALRYLQSGLARSYVALVVLGALLIIGYFVIR